MFKILSPEEIKGMSEDLCNRTKKRSEFYDAMAKLKRGEALQINKTDWKSKYKTGPSGIAASMKNRKHELMSTKDGIYWVIIRSK